MERALASEGFSVLPCDNRSVQTKRLAFAFFAAAILFSMVREWSAPAYCMRPILIPSVTATARH